MDATDLVQLPLMSALGVLAFADQLLSCAAPHKKALPKTCAASLGVLTEKRSILAAALRDRLEPDAGVDLVPLDRVIDSAWSGLSDFSTAFMKLPQGGPLVEAATLVHSTLFADGLKFTQIAFTLEWAESQVRLDRMDQPDLVAALKTIGATTFVEAIRTAHVAYGKALGMGSAKTAAPSPAVRPAYLAIRYAIRLYVVKVIAMIEPDQPETKVLVDALLVPLTTWNVRTGKKGGADQEAEPETEGAAPAVPDLPVGPEKGGSPT